MLPCNLRFKTLIKIRIHRPTTLPLCPPYRTTYACRHMSQHTQDTTLPLKQGSFALSSEISSFTTLEKKQTQTIGRKSRVWNYIRSEDTVVFLNGPGKILIFTKILASASLLCLKNMGLLKQRKQVKMGRKGVFPDHRPTLVDTKVTTSIFPTLESSISPQFLKIWRWLKTHSAVQSPRQRSQITS